MPELLGGIDDAANHELKQAKDRDPSSLNNSFRALQSLEQKMREIAVTGPRVLPGRLVGGGGGEYRTALPGHLRQSRLG